MTGKTKPQAILIVEDESSVLEMLVEFLSDRGYKILTAGSVADAVEVASSFQGTIFLLLVDVKLRDGLGTEAVKRIRSVRTRVNVIYMSGYDRKSVLTDADLLLGEQFMPKPFRFGELVQMVDFAMQINLG